MQPARLVWAGYRAALSGAAPLAPVYLRRRTRHGREDGERLAEKLGRASAPPFADRPLWLHGVSVGEAVALSPLAERLSAVGAPLVLTSGTVLGAERFGALARRLPGPAVHQYAPLDAPRFVARFLTHWRPRAAIFAEAEIWPATLHALRTRGVPRIHVNARLSERSALRWQRLGGIARALFSELDLVLAQTPRHAAHFSALGAPHVRVTGNMKFDAPPPEADATALSALRAAIGARPVLLAASTHEGEEEIVAAAHARLAREAFGDLITVIVPRHPDRAAQIEATLRPSGLALARRSAGEAPQAGFYLADTFGELGTFYSLAAVTLLGGSLVPVGGHNPAEPAAHGTALLTGPSHGEMFAPFLEAGGARMVDAHTLADEVAALLANPAARQRMADAAMRVLQHERGATARTFEAIAEAFPAILSPGDAARAENA